MTLKNLVKICGKQAPKKAVIMLHGYGSNADSIMNLAQDLYADNTIFIAANAPQNWPFDNEGFQWFSLPEDRAKLLEPKLWYDGLVGAGDVALDGHVAVEFGVGATVVDVGV
jgi:predicted esterase